MKISHTLPQFTDRPAYLAVASTHRLLLYRALEGNIERVQEVRIDPSGFTDNEGFFTHGGKGMKYGSSGAVREPNKHEEVRRCGNAFAELVVSVGHEQGSCALYVFSPSYLTPILIHALPPAARRAYRGTIEGIHLHDHPFELLGRISSVERQQ